MPARFRASHCQSICVYAVNEKKMQYRLRMRLSWEQQNQVSRLMQRILKKLFSLRPLSRHLKKLQIADAISKFVNRDHLQNFHPLITQVFADLEPFFAETINPQKSARRKICHLYCSSS